MWASDAGFQQEDLDCPAGAAQFRLPADLPIDWESVTAGRRRRQNYQILPGDRLFVAEDEMVTSPTSWSRSPVRSSAWPASSRWATRRSRLSDDGRNYNRSRSGY